MLMFMFYLIWLFNAILFRLYEPYAYLRVLKSRPMIFVGIAFVVMLIFLVIRKYEKTIGIYLILSGALLAVCVVYMATLIPDRKILRYTVIKDCRQAEPMRKITVRMGKRISDIK